MTWECAICKMDTRTEYYMVRNDIWEQYGCEPLLCIGCLEARMGRGLMWYDFIDAPINQLDFFEKSDRLVNRLTRIRV
jgi:hypothetical protein